jgi:5-(carboxyamino)imidazole ribonucleotide synthase
MTAAGVIVPPATLGVVGGGQLGRMFVQAAQRLGYDTVALCPHGGSPAAQVAGEVIVGASDDLDALRALAARASAVTVEFENVSAAGLRWLGRRVPVRPGWRTIWTAQNRIREKSFLAARGFPVARWRTMTEVADLAPIEREFPGPAIVKTAASGYDGKGQVRIDGPDALGDAWAALGRAPCVIEEVVRFAAEVSCIVARNPDGQSVAFPVAWNRHDRHILDTSVAPAPIGPHATRRAQDLAVGVAEALGNVGLLTVEFFLTIEGDLLINELAPRPHNSGHLTIEAAVTSQFEQQVRALCDLPLGDTRLRQPAAMANLLGDLWAAGPPDWPAALRTDPGAHLHLYGKRTAKPGRKMGHLTVLDPDPDAALARALAARAALAGGERVPAESREA